MNGPLVRRVTRSTHVGVLPSTKGRAAIGSLNDATAVVARAAGTQISNS